MMGWRLLWQGIRKGADWGEAADYMNGANSHWRHSIRNSSVQQLDHLQNLLIGVMYFRACTHLQLAARI
jgi:hypothetical protein